MSPGRETLRFEAHVRPGASRAGVGGAHDGALVVRVVEPPVGGRATEAALRAIADALSVPRRSVALVRGATGRRKVIEVGLTVSERPAVEHRLAALLGAGR